MELNPMQVALNTVRTLRLELMQLIIEIGEGVKEDGGQTDPKDNRYMYSMNEMVGKLGLHMRLLIINYFFIIFVLLILHYLIYLYLFLETWNKFLDLYLAHLVLCYCIIHHF